PPAAGGPSEGSVDLLEALAGLQYLMATATTDGVAGEGGAYTAALAVRVQTDGPYLVTGGAALHDWLGGDVPTFMPVALCRCGRSGSKPFCDGTHVEVQFSGDKDPHRVADRRDRYEGQRIALFDNRGICAHSGFCTNRAPDAFRTDQEPFVAASGARFDDLVKAAQQCPSGALSFALAGREEQREEVDTERPPAIEISSDGPYRVTGQI